jgi:hypothetical protein
VTDSLHPNPDDPGQGSPSDRSRPAALGPRTNRTAVSSLPWRPSDTGFGNGSTASLEPLSEEGLARLADTLANDLREDSVFVTRCSWCHRFDVDGWCDVATAARRLRDRDPGSIPTITHGICETCVVAFEQSL